MVTQIHPFHSRIIFVSPFYISRLMDRVLCFQIAISILGFIAVLFCNHNRGILSTPATEDILVSSIETK